MSSNSLHFEVGITTQQQDAELEGVILNISKTVVVEVLPHPTRQSSGGDSLDIRLKWGIFP